MRQAYAVVSEQVVEIISADHAECQKRVGIKPFRQRVCRKLPEFDPRLQRDFDDGSRHGLGPLDDIGRGNQSHAVDKPHQALLLAA